jgi:hypothetical protein
VDAARTRVSLYLEAPAGPIATSRVLEAADEDERPLRLLADAAAAERYLSLPQPEIGGEVAPFFERAAALGERGIVLVSLGENPAGRVVDLFGVEGFAVMSVEARGLVLRLMERELDTQLRLLRFLIERGVGPYFAIRGEEKVAPPLHGRRDFVEFNARHDRGIVDLVHEAGGVLNVHCLGRLRSVLDLFVDLGVDALHPIESPPVGDVTPRQAKEVLRGKVAIEGTIQIADMYEAPPEDVRGQAEALVEDCFGDRRGLIVSPTASPTIPGRGADCLPRYKAMIEAVRR